MPDLSIRDVRDAVEHGRGLPALRDGERWRCGEAVGAILEDSLRRPLSIKEVATLSALMDCQSTDLRARASGRAAIAQMESMNQADQLAQQRVDNSPVGIMARDNSKVVVYLPDNGRDRMYDEDEPVVKPAKMPVGSPAAVAESGDNESAETSE